MIDCSAIEASRVKLLSAIADSPDVVYLRGYGNLGDQLISAGTRKLLGGTPYREASILNLGNVHGHTALIAGGGAWCKPYHDMPPLLASVEERFERVIILPSSFDISVASVREALRLTKARVFAREEESFRQIRDLCDADLAHDCAFFFGYAPYTRPGAGTLNAFRLDQESALTSRPDDNQDISLACSSLDEWLWTIARHQIIRTDRAHVMIAGALLGKPVEFCTSNYHKVPAIAAYALQQFPVTQIPAESRWITLAPPAEQAEAASQSAPKTTAETRARMMACARDNLKLLPCDFWEHHRSPQLTVVMLSQERLEQTSVALRALKENVAVPFKLLLIDNGSRRETQTQLQHAAAQYDFAEVVLLDKNLGCAGGRAFALERVTTDFVLFLDNDVEVFPGTVEHLLNALDRNPTALAAGANIVLANGRVHLCGGDYWVENDVLRYSLLGSGKSLDEAATGGSGRCSWVSGTCTLFRRQAFAHAPLDIQMSAYYEDLEWCYRVQRQDSAVFYRCAEALALHNHQARTMTHNGAREANRQRTAPFIETIAYFYQKHGKVIQNLFDFVPELGTPNEWSAKAAKLFLELVTARGMAWVLQKWNAHELDLFFTSPAEATGELYYRQRELVALIAERQQAVESLAAQMDVQVQKVNSLVTLIGERQQAVNSLTAELTEKEKAVQELNHKLNAIYSSRLWRVGMLYRSVSERFRSSKKPSPMRTSKIEEDRAG
jgi:GT2 family glycosyltransferase